jgi:hypothetical protein
LFFAIMGRHHLGGAHMSSAAAERAEDPWVRTLAERMARGQRAEVNEYAAAFDRLGLAVPEGFEELPRLDLTAAEPDESGSSPLVFILAVLIGGAVVLVAAVIWRTRRAGSPDGELEPDRHQPATVAEPAPQQLQEVGHDSPHRGG